MGSNEGLRLIRSRKGTLELWPEREQRLIRAAVRTGTCGLLGGALAYGLGTAGIFVPLRWAFVGVGLTAGGISAAIGSILVLRRVWGGPFRVLKVASVLGVPFGISTAMLGAGWLSRNVTINAMTAQFAPVTVVLGATLCTLAGVGLARRMLNPAEESTDSDT